MCIQERGNAPWEEQAYDAMRGIKTDNVGVCYLRLHQDEFDVIGPSGYEHHAFIFAPAACNFAQFLRVAGPVDMLMVKVIMRQALHALDFLHRDVHCVHTDVKANNILLQLKDHRVLEEWAQSLEETPPVSKGSREEGTLVYHSRHLKNLGKAGWDAPILSDLGEARLLGDQEDLDPLPMGPLAYRAPENVLGMRWGYPVDVWQAACMFYNLCTNEQLFDVPDGTEEWSVTSHLAQMVGLMGPPPAEFIKRSEDCKQYFDDEGVWKGHEGYVVPDVSLEQKFAVIESEQKEAMLDFVRDTLRWKPEERKTAIELAHHPFLRFEDDLGVGGGAAEEVEENRET